MPINLVKIPMAQDGNNLALARAAKIQAEGSAAAAAADRQAVTDALAPIDFAKVSQVADRSADVATVAARDADVGKVAAVDVDVVKVAAIEADIRTLAPFAADIPAAKNAPAAAAQAKAWATEPGEIEPGRLSARGEAERSRSEADRSHSEADLAATHRADASQRAEEARTAALLANAIPADDVADGLQRAPEDGTFALGYKGRYRVYRKVAGEAVQIGRVGKVVLDAFAETAELTYAEIAPGEVFEIAGARYVPKPVIDQDAHFDNAGTGGIKFDVLPVGSDWMISHFDPDPANAKVAWKRAVGALKPRHRLVVDVPIDTDYEAFDEIPKMDPGDYIVFRAPVTHHTFGVPCIWHETDGSSVPVILETPQFLYAGTATRQRPDLMQVFYGQTWTAAAPYSNRAQAGLFFSRGGTVTIKGTFEARAVDFSPEKLIPRAFVMLQGPNAEPGNVYGDDFRFDGILFGIIATGVDNFWIGDVYSDRWSQLQTQALVDGNEYEWEAPGHIWYFTPNATGAYNIKIGNCYDEGTEVGTPFVTGATSYKCTTRASSFQIGFLFSRRSQGIADLEVANARMAGGYWDGSRSSAAQLGGGKAARFSNFNDGGSQSVDFGNWYFLTPDDYDGYVQVDATRATGSFRFEVPGAAMNSPFLLGVMTRCDFEIAIETDQAQAAAYPTVVRIDSGGSDNRFDIRTTSPQWDRLRVIAQDKAASSGNNATIPHLQTGSRRSIANRFELAEVVFDEEVAAAAGKSVVVPTQIPDGAEIRSLMARVTEALGTSAGATGFHAGARDAVFEETDIFGSAGTVAGARTDDATWRRHVSGRRAAATNIVLSARDGTFDGTGKVRVTGRYTRGLYNADLV